MSAALCALHDVIKACVCVCVCLTQDPGVMSAALCALHDVIKGDPAPYKNLIPSFTSILKQVAEHRLPKSYDYHRFPAPFIQVGCNTACNHPCARVSCYAVSSGVPAGLMLRPCLSPKGSACV